jgi:archaellum component FlaF (FlaF/FlaG flagellin family)
MVWLHLHLCAFKAQANMLLHRKNVRQLQNLKLGMVTYDYNSSTEEVGVAGEF